MLIKEAYQRRIQQQILNHSPTYLKIKTKSPVIGSIKSGRFNFSNNQNYFTQNDLSLKNQQLKKQTKQFIDPDILQLKKKKWKNSVQTSSSGLFQQIKDTHEQTLFKIKKGFHDFGPQTQTKSRKIYPGTQTRNNYKGWNVSALLTQNQKQSSFNNLFINSIQNTISYNQERLKNYSKPHFRYDQTRSIQKQRKIKELQLENTLKNKIKKQNPDTSPQKLNATVFKLLQQNRRAKLSQMLYINKDELQMTKRFRASLSDSQKIKFNQVYYHNGCWSKVPMAPQNYAWSCCMNESINGKGCVRKIIDGNKSNYSSYNA